MRNICITRSGLLTLVFTVTCAFCTVAQAQSIAANSEAGTAAVEPYPNMPAIPPIGVRTGKYFDVPASAKGPAVDPAKGYRLQDFGNGLYMITDNQIQSMFLVYERGVVIMDAPQAYAAHIRQAVAEVTDKPITHLIYSHFHADHIGGAKTLGDVSVIIAHEETLRFLKRDADPNRPLPTITFKDKYTLHVGSQTLELSYHGPGHAPGNIFIYAPKQRVLMVIDTAKAMSDAMHAIVSAFPAGCNPVGVAASPGGERIWVTARGANRLLRFQSADWSAGAEHVASSSFEIGPNPVGVTVRPDAP